MAQFLLSKQSDETLCSINSVKEHGRVFMYICAGWLRITKLITSLTYRFSNTVV